MNSYLINYYSNTFKKNQKLEARIKNISDQYIQVFPNTWFIITSEISRHLIDLLTDVIEKEDQIIITDTNGECSAIGLKEDTFEFIKANC
ncbi:hypothetical protein [Chryseobacterium sp.]|uniref:hypothetical protein n=1 Tax=Chryseobacterium sp. TaxID=1871047 RepID=UPI00289D0A13|nr:hypothetical protein [Chryseobacterium sp.]